MLATEAAGEETHPLHGAAGAVGPGDRLATVASTFAFTGSGKEQFGLVDAHGPVGPLLADLFNVAGHLVLELFALPATEEMVAKEVVVEVMVMHPMRICKNHVICLSDVLVLKLISPAKGRPSMSHGGHSGCSRAKSSLKLAGHMSGNRWRVTLIACVLIALATLTGTAAPSAANELPWRDLDEALIQLERAQTASVDIETALRSTEEAMAASASTMGYVVASEGDRATTLETWRRRSRQLAVESYINGGPAQASLHLLDTHGAVDLTYRSVLLRDQAQAALDASNTYATLLGDADEDLVVLVEDLDGLGRRLEGLLVDQERVAAQIIEAEWVVEIARVHAAADREFERTGRRDPTITDWHELAFCESTNRYDVNTGNGFYGAYQFDYQTWFTVGGEPGTRADQAPPEEQDARARLLYSRRGSQPWPECGWNLDS